MHGRGPYRPRANSGTVVAMSITILRPSATSPRRAVRPARRLLPDLERPGLMFANLTPNWYASIMGTGIVAVAAASLPDQFPGLRPAATAFWGVAAALLVALTAATLVHWRKYPQTARWHAKDPIMLRFYGALP